MKSCLLKGLVILISLIIAAGAILWVVKEAAEAVVETIDDTYDVKNYTTFIDDNVRYTLTSVHPSDIYSSNTELESKADRKIEEYASSFDDVDQPSYKLALKKLSKEGNSFEKKYAANLLKIYNNLKIDLTPFERDKEKRYKYRFMEKNSRVHFTVSVGVLCLFDADIWDLGRYAEYLETGVFENAPDGSTSIVSVDDDIKNNYLSDTEKEKRNAILIEIVERAYSGQANDEEILYPTLYELISKNNDHDQWANLGYWKYSDGHLHSYHINGVHEDEWGNVYVMVHISDMKHHDQAFGDIHDVWLGMTQDNGKWYISWIDGYSKDNRLVYSSSDMIY